MLADIGLDGDIFSCPEAQIAKPIEHPPRRVDADQDEGDQLDQRFHGDGEHQAILMLGRVDVACAKRHGETGQQERDDQSQRACGAARHHDLTRIERIEHHDDRAGDRLQLQGDIGHGANDADDRDQPGDLIGLAIARGDKVGDRGDVLRLGQPHDAQHQRRQQADDNERPDVNRQELQPALRGKANGTEEGPGGAIDRQRQRIDDRPGAGGNEMTP